MLDQWFEMHEQILIAERELADRVRAFSRGDASKDHVLRCHQALRGLRALEEVLISDLLGVPRPPIP